MLQEGILLYFKDSIDLYHPQGVIYLQRDTFVDETPETAISRLSEKIRKKYKHLFMIRAQGKRFLISCESEEDWKNWITHLHIAIARYAGKGSSFRSGGGGIGIGNGISNGSGSGFVEVDIDAYQAIAAERNVQSKNSVTESSSVAAGVESRINPHLALQQLQREQQKVLKLTALIDSMSQPFAVLSSKCDDLKKMIEGLETRMEKVQQRALHSKEKMATRSNREESDSDESDVDSEVSEEFAAVRRVDSNGSSRTFTLSSIAKSKNESDPTKRAEAMMIAMDELSEEYDICKDSLQKQIDRMMELISAGLSLPLLANHVRKLRQQQMDLRDTMQKQWKMMLQQEMTDCQNRLSDRLTLAKLLTSSENSNSQSGEAKMDNKGDSNSRDNGDGNDDDARIIRLQDALQEQIALNRQLQQQHSEREQSMKDQIAELTQHRKILVREVKNLRAQRQTENK